MKNSDFVIEQYRRGKLVRSFFPTGDKDLPWRMEVNGRSYLRSHGWILSKILPTLMESSIFITKAIVNNEDSRKDVTSGGV